MARDYEAFFADEHNKSVVLDLVGELDIDESYEKAEMCIRDRPGIDLVGAL